jgi:molybdopterin-guanine dinucleotide biosynthesis protein A
MGRDKMRLEFGGRSLLGSAVERFSRYFDTILVSVARPGEYAGEGFETVPDIFPGCGPLSGLHAALAYARDDGVFLAAGDLPFADPALARKLAELCGSHEICVLDGTSGKREPLFGFYKSSLLERANLALLDGRHSMTEFLASSDTLSVPPALLGGLWHEKLLTNINYPSDYALLTKGGETSAEESAQC